MDWSNALSSLATAIGIAKDLRDIEKGFDEGAIKAKMADIYTNLSDVKMALADAKEELATKERAIDELKKSFQFGKSLIEFHGYKFEPSKDGGPMGMPFCPRCEQKEGMYFRLASFGKGFFAFKCPECKAEYQDIPSFVWDD